MKNIAGFFSKRSGRSGKPHLTIAGRSAMTGRLFVLPFTLGFLFFFLSPMIQSISFMFNTVKLGVGKFETTFVGLGNLEYIFKEDPDYNKNLVTAFTQMLYQVPVVLIAALFFAIILNQKFKGRTFVRAIFFLPVIITSGVVMSIIHGDAFASSLITSSQGMAASTSSTSFGLQEILIQMGLNKTLVGYFSSISSNLFDLLWRTGIQMIIFLTGLQSIPPTLYEASAMEGASAWENFWMVTIPMLAPMILVNLIYTVVDTFTDSTNVVMQMVTDSTRMQQYHYAAAMSWIYFLMVGVLLAVVAFIFNKATQKSLR